MELKLVRYETLADCRRQIRDDFVADCTNRARVGRLPAGTCAGGQYFSQPEQRGILGTAAALRVLSIESRAHQPSRDVARGLVRYLAHRRRIELDASRATPQERALWRQKLPRDESNTIRQSELLLSLTYVPSALAPCDDMRSEVASRLLRGRSQDGNGWGYALGAQSASSPLPTCHAVRSLARNGNDVSTELSNLERALHERIRRGERDIGLAYVDCFIALVLDELDALSGKEVRAAVDHLWPILASHLGMSREANIDVLGGSANDFVRVPWQLHLMALTARTRPWRRFLTPSMQRLLSDVVNGVLGRRPGFRYPESGDNVSTRTYAYVHETMATIMSTRGAGGTVDTSVARLLRGAERPRRSVRRLARMIAVAGVVLIVGVSIAMWLMGRAGGWKDLAPNFVAAMLIAVFGWVVRPKS